MGSDVTRSNITRSTHQWVIFSVLVRPGAAADALYRDRSAGQTSSSSRHLPSEDSNACGADAQAARRFCCPPPSRSRTLRTVRDITRDTPRDSGCLGPRQLTAVPCPRAAEHAAAACATAACAAAVLAAAQACAVAESNAEGVGSESVREWSCAECISAGAACRAFACAPALLSLLLHGAGACRAGAWAPALLSLLLYGAAHSDVQRACVVALLALLGVAGSCTATFCVSEQVPRHAVHVVALLALLGLVRSCAATFCASEPATRERQAGPGCMLQSVAAASTIAAVVRAVRCALGCVC